MDLKYELFPTSIDKEELDSVIVYCENLEDVVKALTKYNIPTQLPRLLEISYPTDIIIYPRKLTAFPKDNESINLSQYTKEVEYFKLYYKDETADNVMQILDWIYTNKEIKYPTMHYVKGEDGYLYARKIETNDRFEQLKFNYFKEYIMSLNSTDDDFIEYLKEEIEHTDGLPTIPLIDFIDHYVLKNKIEFDYFYDYLDQLKAIDTLFMNSDRHCDNIYLLHDKKSNLIYPAPVHDFDMCCSDFNISSCCSDCRDITDFITEIGSQNQPTATLKEITEILKLDRNKLQIQNRNINLDKTICNNINITIFKPLSWE